MMPYTGIGPRKTPPDILDRMKVIADFLGKKGFTLRSGGADGADRAFEEGCDTFPKEIFLPWKGFNENPSVYFLKRKSELSERCEAIAAALRPAWDNCNHAAKKLHARNVLQVLGWNLDTPSEFLVCWTPDGTEFGGTATDIKLAKLYEVAVCNLAVQDFRTFWRGYAP